MKDLMFPSTMTNSLSEKDEELVISFMGVKKDADHLQNLEVMQLIAGADSTFQEFCQIFAQSVRDGSYQRFGGKVTRRTPNFKLGDFVLILWGHGVKYGLIEEIVSKHTITVKLLNKNMKSKNQTRLQSFSCEQVTLLYQKV